jgi:DNA polymerase-3 subunit delta'
MSFRDILGHSKQINILKRAITGSRVAHSYLFAGPEGVGKMLVARAFAKALNCENPPGYGEEGGDKGGDEGVDSCGACASCRAMEDGFHINLVKVEPVDGVVKIDQVRDLQNAMKYRVTEGRRVAIVDGADKLIKAASNAFLKTLEEPPAGSMIILLTSHPAELLPTVVSRCQRIDFGPLPEEIIRRVLVEKLADDGLGEEDAQAFARVSGGSLARALKAVKSGEQAKKVEFLERFLSLSPGKNDEILDVAREVSKDPDVEGTLEFLKTFYRDLVVFNEGSEGLVVAGNTAQKATNIGYRGFARLVRSFELIEEAHRNITPPRYANKQLTMEVLFLGLVDLSAPVT